MIIMIVVMLLPVLAIPAFWFLPLSEAVPIYVVCCLLSGLMFWLMRGNMRRSAKVGSQSLVGKEAKVISYSGPDKIAPYQVRIEGEIWGAGSRDSLERGETAVILAVEGNKLMIACKDNGKRGNV
jgi:membrane protein implicated in regulation of membrane protease activity